MVQEPLVAAEDLVGAFAAQHHLDVARAQLREDEARDLEPDGLGIFRVPDRPAKLLEVLDSADRPLVAKAIGRIVAQDPGLARLVVLGILEPEGEGCGRSTGWRRASG